MSTGKVGDRVIAESQKVGNPGRSGDIVEVIGQGEATHYRVRWADGHESMVFPKSGSLQVVARARKR